MKGTKRLGVTDSKPEANDSIFQSKRIMVGTQFDIHRAEPSQRQSAEAPPLDIRQAESARQHVRALNTQFASWVQTQLENYPDELWEDGTQDYLTHASNIVEKFSDVVKWLKAKSAKTEILSGLGSQIAQKNLLPENKNLGWTGIPPAGPTAGSALSWGNPIQKNIASEGEENELMSSSERAGFAPAATSAGFAMSWGNSFVAKIVPEGKDNEVKSGHAPVVTSASFGMTWGPAPNKVLSEAKDNGTKPFSESSGFTTAGISTGFAMPWSSGPLFNSKTSFSFGNQTSNPVAHDVSNDADGEDDVEQPSSPSVKRTEEKGINVVHEMKCKLYVKSSDPVEKDTWKEKGTGQLSIKCKEGASKGTRESKPTIIVRNDVGKILLNALLYPGIKTNMQKNSIVAIFHTSEDDNSDNVVARTFLIRAKTEEDRNKLASVIKEYAPAP